MEYVIFGIICLLTLISGIYISYITNKIIYLEKEISEIYSYMLKIVECQNIEKN